MLVLVNSFVSKLRSPLHRTRLLPNTWARAVDLILCDPETSALSLQRGLGLGSYRTAWRMAGIIREALGAMEWPLLGGDVEVCDVSLAAVQRGSKSLWFACERRSAGGGIIRGWRVSPDVATDFSRIARGLDPVAILVTPPSGVFRELKKLGFRLRSEPLGAADSLPAATAAVVAFSAMLRARRHHGVAAGTIELYLGEFIFRHNAKVLGWSLPEQRRRVMDRLLAPPLSA